jgi:hypothetical protein
MRHRSLAHVSGSVLAAAVLFALTPSLVTGAIPTGRSSMQAASDPHGPVLSPVTSPYGKTYSEWSVLWWQWFLPLSSTQFNTCAIGQGANNVAFLLAGPPSCAGTVPSGTALFFPVANVECSSLEQPPFYGADADARETCAKRFFHKLQDGSVSFQLDGVSVQSITSYHTESPDFSFTVGSDNVFNIPCAGSCTGQSTAFGYYLMLAPLPPGTHTLHMVAPNYGIDTSWVLVVAQ